MLIPFNPCSIQSQVIAAYQAVSPGMSGYRSRGLGCPECQGTCEGMTGWRGLGQALSFPNLYPPFESTDYTTWGWEEYGILGLLGYGVISAFLDAVSVGKRTHARAKQGYKRAKRSVKKSGTGAAVTVAALVGGAAIVFLLWPKISTATTGASS
jgi:hypothetical protein